MYIYIYILFNSFDPFKFQQLLAITMEDFRPSAPSSTKDSVLERRLVQQNMDSGGPYRLLQCSSKGDKAGVIQELEKGVDPNVADYDRRTALHLAACEGWTEVVVLLLEKGADVNSLDRWCRTVSLIYILLFLAWRFLFLVILIDQKGFDAGNFCSHCLMRVALVIMRFARYLKLKGELIRESYKAHFQHYLTRPLVGVDSQAPCFEIDHYEVNMDEATLIGEGAYGEVYLVKWRGTEVAAKTIRSSIASNPKAKGMNYLHQHKPHAIIHRDLTPRNVLQDEAGRLKVTDFGLSKLAQEKDSYGYKMTGGTGSYRYMAPEVYRRESYGKSIDVFSFALIVHEMFQGGPSHRGETAEQVADKRAYEDLRPPLSSYIYPEPIKTLLRECWHKNPDCRPTFEEIILKLEVIQQRFQRKNAMKACSCCVVL
ncbi:serine/threonine-protein kinase mos-like isoform X5 [Durio zibethinus]|uniref:Serine/threonine-protein kinase mos-like isoform X5 n=1 Tax=Durio zibethinus TaxID=66656 RepID=A0A6P5ZXS9_DURZI|nr:serine/threonine-protein kinase mos-like isoform X5 [Durio zibethinus]